MIKMAVTSLPGFLAIRMTREMAQFELQGNIQVFAISRLLLTIN